MLNLFFYSISGVIVISAIMVVLSKNIFRSALFLALCLISTAGLYLFLNASFLAAIQLLIYVGGIVTLILFAIMLTAQSSNGQIKQTNSQVFQSAVVICIIFAVFLSIIRKININLFVNINKFADVNEIAKIIFSDYVLQFEVLSIVLLVALIGAIIIAKKD